MALAASRPATGRCERSLGAGGLGVSARPRFAAARAPSSNQARPLPRDGLQAADPPAVLRPGVRGPGGPAGPLGGVTGRPAPGPFGGVTGCCEPNEGAGEGLGSGVRTTRRGDSAAVAVLFAGGSCKGGGVLPARSPKAPATSNPLLPALRSDVAASPAVTAAFALAGALLGAAGEGAAGLTGAGAVWLTTFPLGRRTLLPGAISGISVRLSPLICKMRFDCGPFLRTQYCCSASKM